MLPINFLHPALEIFHFGISMKSVQIGCRNFFFTQNLKIFRNKISRFFQKISKFKSIESIKLEAQLKVYCTHFTIETTYLIIFRDMHFKYTPHLQVRFI